MKGLTAIDGILVGHASDYEGLTGCTAILLPHGAVAGLDIRGSATGSAEFDLLSPGHLTGHIHGLVLTGGSAFGLESAGGVRRFLEEKGIGFPTGGGQVVPLVPCAVIYDLDPGKSAARPTLEMGYAAAAAASADSVEEGSVGAGTGATVGKLFGMAQAMKGGVGSSVVDLQGARVAALAVVNAFGDVLDPSTGAILAGARTTSDSREFAGTASQFLKGATRGFAPTNTTLVVVATDAALDKVQAAKLAQHASAGVARVLSPGWTVFDGDVCFALSCGSQKADLTALGIAAAEAAAQAIARGVLTARTLGGVPGLA